MRVTATSSSPPASACGLVSPFLSLVSSLPSVSLSLRLDLPQASSPPGVLVPLAPGRDLLPAPENEPHQHGLLVASGMVQGLHGEESG